MCAAAALQDGRHAEPEGSAEAERLDDKTRPKGCVLHHPNTPRPPAVPVEEQSFQFTCLPFGLSSAPWIFTKILKPVTALLREHGVRLIIYIDDILIMSES